MCMFGSTQISKNRMNNGLLLGNLSGPTCTCEVITLLLNTGNILPCSGYAFNSEIASTY